MEPQIPKDIQSNLPSQFSHRIVLFRQLEVPNQYELKLHTPDVASKHDVEAWIKVFCENSKQNFVIHYTAPTANVAFKGSYICHLRKPRQCSCLKKAACGHKHKGIGCEAKIHFRIGNINDGCHIRIYHTHNHELTCVDALRKLPVSEASKTRILNLFSAGYSPAAALNVFKTELMTDLGDDYFELSCDRSECPDLQFVNRLYQSVFKETYGPVDGPSAVENLKQFVEAYTAENKFEFGSAAVEERGSDLFVAVVTPLMSRIHKNIQQSGELVFVDASGNYDIAGTRVVLFLTHSVAGGLPIAVGLTTTESEVGLTALFHLIKSLLPPACFYGRGSDLGPSLFMTDDSRAEVNSLRSVWPNVRCLQCIFHAMQSCWRWLRQGKNQIAACDCRELYGMFKNLIYAESVAELERNFVKLSNSKTCAKYPQYVRHISSEYWARKEDFFLAYRKDLLTRGNETNNFVESNIRVTKDVVFKRLKVFNVTQLLDFVANKMENYYKRRLVDTASLRSSNPSKFLVDSRAEISGLVVAAAGDSLYQCTNAAKGTSYVVDMSCGTCECHEGQNGGLCKHQKFIIQKYSHENAVNCITESSSLRSLLWLVATGKPPRDGLFAPLFENAAAPSELSPLEDPHDDSEADSPELYCDDARNIDSIEMEDLSSSAPLGEASVESGVNINELSRQTDDIFRHISQRLNEASELFAPAVSAFISNFHNFAKTDNGLVSSLACFGKYTAGASQLSLRRSTKQIPVNVTNAARRKFELCGRTPIGPGRPRTAKEDLPDKTEKPAALPNFRKAKQVPHSLSACVASGQHGISLPKKH